MGVHLEDIKVLLRFQYKEGPQCLSFEHKQKESTIPIPMEIFTFLRQFCDEKTWGIKTL